MECFCVYDRAKEQMPSVGQLCFLACLTQNKEDMV